MALGTISSIGLGSSLDLQNMLDQLKEIDEQPIKIKETTMQKSETQVQTLDSLNARLVKLKSSALSLSLESNFLARKTSVGDEEVLSATTITGTELTTHNLEVKALAQKSSWQSKGFASEETMVYSEPKTDFEDGETKAITADTTLSFTYGGGETLSIDLKKDATLDEVATAINEASVNQDEEGNPLAKATVVEGEDGAYIRMEAANPDTKTNQQILVSAGPDFIKPDLTFTYRVGIENDPVYVNVKAGTSYKDLAGQINESSGNTGIHAEIIDDGSTVNGNRFTLTAKNTGEANRIFLDGLAMEEVQGADKASLNAKFSLNGISYQRGTNEGIEDVISGVTLEFKAEGKTSLSVRSDTEAVKEDIMELINGFIEFSEEIHKHTNIDPEAEDEGLLKDLYSVKGVLNDLTDLMNVASSSHGGVSSLFDLGLTMDRQNITFDESKLDEMLAKDPAAVQRFFVGDEDRGITGFAENLNERLKEMSGNNGVLNLEKSAANDKVKRLETDIEESKTRLEKKYESMAKEFIQLDKAVRSLNSQADFLKSTFDSFNNAANKD